MRSVTVKIPARWKVDSQHVQGWLRDYFVHPVALPSDTFAAEKAVCFSLNERQADALARGLGEPRAVALRRLLAAHVQELPPAPGAIVHVSKRERPKAVRRGANSDSEFIAGQSATREIGERQFVDITEDAPTQPARSLVQSAAPSENTAVVKRPFVLGSMVFYIVPLVVLFVFLGGSVSVSSGASSEPGLFSEWRPE